MGYKAPTTKHTFCFDLDDTLIHTRRMYNYANYDCGRFLIDQLGSYMPLGAELLQRREAIDQKLLDTLHYSSERVPLSWALLYREICEENSVPISRRILAELRTRASFFQEPPFELISGVEAMLRSINRKIATPILLTVGDKQLQRLKVSTNPVLAETFKEEDGTFLICATTKIEVLKRLVADNEGSGKVVMVGDSLRMDMETAQEAGAVSVHVPTPGHWYNDDAVVEPDYTLKSIEEFPALVDRMLSLWSKGTGK